MDFEPVGENLPIASGIVLPQGRAAACGDLGAAMESKNPFLFIKISPLSLTLSFN